MPTKSEVTRAVLLELKPDADQEMFNTSMSTWWANTRRKRSGGWALTDLGVTCFLQAGIKEYRIDFNEPVVLSSQVIIWLDHYLECPHYIYKDSIIVFDEKVAVQLVLFSGNIVKFVRSKASRYDRDLAILDKK